MELEDTALLIKLALGNLIALEAKYHRKCLPKLYSIPRATDSIGTSLYVDANLHGIAFAELVACMEDFCMNESVIPMFKLSGLAYMYKVRLAQLDADIEGRIHSYKT